MFRKGARGAVEASEVQPLVQVRHAVGMDRLQSHGDLESTGDLLCKFDDPRPDGARVRLYRDRLERARHRCNAHRIVRRNSSDIEEVARVVELESIGRRRRHHGERALHLAGQRTGWRRPVDGILPQVAERAGERTLRASGEKRQRLLSVPIRAALLLDERPVRHKRIAVQLRWTETPDPCVVRGDRHTAVCSVSKWLR